MAKNRRFLVFLALVLALLGMSVIIPQISIADGFTAQNPQIADNAPITLDASGRTVFNVGETQSFDFDVSCAGDVIVSGHLLYDRNGTVYREKSGTVVLLKAHQEITAPFGSTSCYIRDPLDLACQGVPTFYEGTNEVAIEGDACGGAPGCTDGVDMYLAEGEYVYNYRGPGQTQPFEDYNRPTRWSTLLACTIPPPAIDVPTPTQPAPPQAPLPTCPDCGFKTAGTSAISFDWPTLVAAGLLLLGGVYLLLRKRR